MSQTPASASQMCIRDRYGGPCRPPRLPLAKEVADQIIADTKEAAAKGYDK